MKLNKEIKTGIIAVAIISCAIWGFNFLKGKNLLSSSDVYYVLYDNIDGLEEASAVNINGYKIGIVERIALHGTNKEKVLVKFSIEKNIKLPKNSVAEIVPASILAGKALNLNLSEANEFYQPGDTIKGELEIDLLTSLSDELLPIKNKIERLVVSIDSVLTIFDSERRNSLKGSLDNINTITTELEDLLESENSKLNMILTNVESITGNLKNNNEQITNILENFSSISDSIEQADVKTTLLNANKALAEFSEIATKINNGEGTVGMLINNDSLYHNLNSLAADIDSLVIDLNENPKRYVHFSLFGKKDK